MAYLVIGGMGYVGSRVVRDLLNDGKEVVCLVRTTISNQAREVIGEENLNKVKIVPGDVSDSIQVFHAVQENGIDYIIHTANAAGPLAQAQPSYVIRTNSIGMANVLEAARLFGVKRVVWTSALAVCGARLSDFYKEPVKDDDAPYMPEAMYGATKALNEVMARVYYEKFGVDSIGFRMARCFGRSRFNIPFTEFNRKVALNIPVELVDPDYATSYIYVEDTADAHVKACDVPTTKTRVFNLLEGYYGNRQLLETIRKVNPEAQVSLVEGVSDSVVVPRMDGSGLRDELGWQAKYSLEEALREIYNYWRQKEGMPAL